LAQQQTGANLVGVAPRGQQLPDTNVWEVYTSIQVQHNKWLEFLSASTPEFAAVFEPQYIWYLHDLCLTTLIQPECVRKTILYDAFSRMVCYNLLKTPLLWTSGCEKKAWAGQAWTPEMRGWDGKRNVRLGCTAHQSSQRPLAVFSTRQPRWRAHVMHSVPTAAILHHSIAIS